MTNFGGFVWTKFNFWQFQFYFQKEDIKKIQKTMYSERFAIKWITRHQFKTQKKDFLSW